ncbi:bacterial Ig-like domain-containing protein [Enterococcus faecalis]|uniref:bacterial Ig-like domain-containing protein n=1 Tax=Enterococcus faecalis TaxID=1351 RepID=UPI0020919FA2|nr:bacterial Ig-like domain-containing protein [Enterococcus faecalis]MCO5494528.1 bacterial Ig-like domain-containing protein [Enterococcus faecalis]MCO5500697.1 bacterial Ig-like domain-containing protein [Enterococcus faecalis]
MKKIFYITFILILIVFSINQERIAFAETAHVSTEEQPTDNSSNVSKLPTMLSGRELNDMKKIDPYYVPVNGSIGLKDPVIKAFDQYGCEIPVSLLNAFWMYNQPLDTSKPGNKASIGYNYNNGKQFVGVVRVAYKTSIQTKDSMLYVDQEWNPKDNFVSATDEKGEDISFGYRIIKSKDYIDTSIPGVYKITYTYKSQLETVESSFLVTVKEDQTKAKLKDTELYVGQKWDLGSVFKNVVDKDGNPIKPEDINSVWIDGQETRKIDTSKPGQHIVQIAVRTAADRNYWVYSNTVIVTVKDDKTKAELKDTELYVGQKWDLGSVFKNVVDKDGNPIKPGDINSVWINVQGEWIKSKEIDTSKPGQYKVQIDIQNAKYEWIKSNEAIVTVKEDQTKAELKDTELYVGQKWDLGSVFKNVVDKDGNPIKPEEVWVWVDGKETVREIDTSKPGKHTVQIAVRNASDSDYHWTNSNTVTVTVKDDKTKAELKDTELYVGQKWNLGSVFKNVVDKDGNPIKPGDINSVWINVQGEWIKSKEIDTSKPGQYKVQIDIQNAKYEWIKSNEAIVTVSVKELFTIKQVPDFDFDDHILVSTNKSVVNKKENLTIEVETPSILGKDWQLQVELSPFLDKKNSKSILKGVSLFIPKGKLESDLETEEPIQYDCQLEANGKASILMQGTKTKGKGRWKNKLATKEIKLSIPSGNKVGQYESALHWTLLSVPDK